MSAESETATKGDLFALEGRMQERIEASELRLLERMEAVETRLLTAFQQWAVPVNGRLRKLEAGDGVLDERLAMIEERLMTIERRIGPPHQRM